MAVEQSLFLEHWTNSWTFIKRMLFIRITSASPRICKRKHIHCETKIQSTLDNTSNSNESSSFCYSDYHQFLLKRVWDEMKWYILTFGVDRAKCVALTMNYRVFSVDFQINVVLVSKSIDPNSIDFLKSIHLNRQKVQSWDWSILFPILIGSFDFNHQIWYI